MSVTVTSFGFAPTQISGCQLWLDGADPAGTGVVPSAGTLSSWADKSGLGNNTTAPTGRHPTLTLNSLNSLSVMTFSGGQNLTGNISLGGTTFTQFALYSNSAVTVGQAYMDSSDGPVGKLCAQNGGGNQFQPGFAYGSTFQTGGGYRLVSTNCTNPGSSSTVSIWFNGTNQNISGWNFYGAATTAITSVTIGARKDLIYFSGRIAEIIVYNVALTSTQQQQIEGYLAQKWGILSSLPNGVLGKSNTYFTSMSLLSKAGSATVAPIRITPYSSVSFAFAPTQITGCQLWLDAADSSTVTGTTSVTAWTDKSGNANNTTVVNAAVGSPVAPSYSTNSINGLSAITMSGTSFFTGSTNVNSTTLTCFFVGNCVFGTGGSSQQRILGLGVTGLDDYSSTLRPIPLSVISGGTQLLAYRNANMASATVVSGTNFIGCCLFDGTSNYMYKNGTLGTQVASSGTFTTSIYGVGSDAGTQYMFGASSLGTNCLVGKIGEMLLFNTALTTLQRQQVEAYLAQKWGLTASLAAAHPGLTTTYFVNQLFLSRASRTIPVAATKTTGSATGGTVSTANGYRTHSFTTVGSTNFVVTGALKLQVLVVGGGGAGASGYESGGGGAGGAVFNSGLPISAGTYSATVGNGGAGAVILPRGGQGASGTNSSFLTLTGNGGGGGGNYGDIGEGFTTRGTGGQAANGGCGGGGGGNGDGGVAGTAGSGNQGYGGGTSTNYGGSGGGGMGSAGSNATTAAGASGGLGLTYQVGNQSYLVCGGGGGGSELGAAGGSGGSGIGGNGGVGNNTPNGTAPTNGTVNTGSGGGGSYGYTSQSHAGGNGGSGIVIIAYAYP